MFFTKLFYFLKGYVIIRAEGLFIERFINICIRRGIKLQKISKTDKTIIFCTMSMSDFLKLPPVARKTGTGIKIIKKCGFSHLVKRYRKRYAFFAGAILFILFFAVTTRFVWTIEINGATKVKNSEILEVLKSEGLYPGAKKTNVSPPRLIKETLTREFNEISWAWAYLEGCKVRIEIREGTLPPKIVDKTTPCDIVALRDGLIENMAVFSGEPRAESNTAVMAGDLLVAGTITKPDGSGYRLVHSAGEITARTWHEKKGVYNLYNEHRIPTGRKVSAHTLDLFSKTFDLWSKQNTFSEYDVFKKRYDLKLGKKYYLGIGLTLCEYHEVEITRELLPYDTAVAFAEYDLEQKIAAELLPGAILRDKKTKVKNIDNETIEVTLLMEFTEKIGTQAIIE